MDAQVVENIVETKESILSLMKKDKYDKDIDWSKMWHDSDLIYVSKNSQFN